MDPSGEIFEGGRGGVVLRISEAGNFKQTLGIECIFRVWETGDQALSMDELHANPTEI